MARTKHVARVKARADEYYAGPNVSTFHREALLRAVALQLRLSTDNQEKREEQEERDRASAPECPDANDENLEAEHDGDGEEEMEIYSDEE